MAGRTSTTAVMGQPVLWDSLETPGGGEVSASDERLTGDAGSGEHQEDARELGLKARYRMGWAQLHQDVSLKSEYAS